MARGGGEWSAQKPARRALSAQALWGREGRGAIGNDRAMDLPGPPVAQRLQGVSQGPPRYTPSYLRFGDSREASCQLKGLQELKGYRGISGASQVHIIKFTVQGRGGDKGGGLGSALKALLAGLSTALHSPPPRAIPLQLRAVSCSRLGRGYLP